MINAMITNQPFDVMSTIAAANLAPSTTRNYQRAVTGYIETGGGLLDAQALADYASGLTDVAKGPLKAAVRLYSGELVNRLKAQADPENVDFIRAAEYRTEALQEAVKVRVPQGQKTHLWLNQPQVKELFDSCGADLQGERDRLALGLLAAAGLRRQEAADLTFDDVKLQPVEGRLRTVLAIEGKGKKRRTVPISDSLAEAIAHWGQLVGHRGRVLRSIDQRGNLRDSMSAVAIFNLVRKHGAAIGLPELAPHDLRRTYAQLGFEAGVPITQISTLLGHASVATTQRYLNLALDLETTISDFIPFEARR